MESENVVVVNNDIICSHQEAFTTDINLDEILLWDVVQSDELIRQSQNITTELQQEAFENSKNVRHILCGETNGDVVELQILQLEMKADDESDEVTPPNHSGDRGRRDSQLSSSSQAFSLRLEDDLDDNFEALNDIDDEETIDESDKEDRYHTGLHLSSLSFSKNEEICDWLQKQVEMEQKQDHGNYPPAKTLEKTPSQSPSTVCNPGDNSCSPRNEFNSNRKMGEKGQEVGHISETKNSEINALSNKRRRKSTEVQKKELRVSVPYSLEANSLVTVRSLRNRICVSVNANSIVVSNPTQIDFQSDNISGKGGIDGKCRNVKPIDENKPTRKGGITKRQKKKSALR